MVNSTNEINIQIVNKCPLQCRFCHNTWMDEETKEIKSNRLMSTLTFSDVVDKCINAGKTDFCLTPMHGEVFSDSEFIEKLKILENNPKVNKFFFATNLLLVTDEQLNELLKFKKLFLEISVYGFTEDEYKTITNRSAFKKFKERLLSLFKISLATYHSLRNIRFFIRVNYDKNILDNWMDFGDIGKYLKLSNTVLGYDVSQTEMLNFNLGGVIPNNSIPDMHPLINKNGICPTAISGCINELGDYCMCYMNDPKEILKIGNIFITDLIELEKSPIRLKILNDMENNKYIKPCKNCNEIW